MKPTASHASVLAVALIPFLYTGSANAQATRTWVSGVGDDVNPCSRTAPCKTFAGAISKTFINGEINCLDPGGFGAVTITKSMTIDCHEIFASILASGTTGIVISIAVNANDPLRTVRIRNLNINGAGASGTVGTRTGIRGIRIDNALAVFVEDTMIRNFTLQGILDQRTTGGALFINNTTVQDNGGTGIDVTPSSGGTKIAVTIAKTISERNANGIKIGNGVNAIISRSVASGNTTDGILVEGPGTASQANIDGTTISNNGTGVHRTAGGTIRLSNNDISFNGTGTAGITSSFGNNRRDGNTANGVAPTPISED